MAVRDITPDAKLMLVGVGELMDAIKEKVLELGIGNQVVFAGA